MAYGRWRRGLVRKGRIEIIPLIDVMFLLLCFFVYATMNMVVQQGIFVDLAPSATSERVTEEEPLTVSVDAEGTLYMNKKPVSRERLKTELTRIKHRSAQKTVMVNADRDAAHGRVIDLLDLVRASGVRTAVFAVEPQN